MIFFFSFLNYFLFDSRSVLVKHNKIRCVWCTCWYLSHLLHIYISGMIIIRYIISFHYESTTKWGCKREAKLLELQDTIKYEICKYKRKWHYLRSIRGLGCPTSAPNQKKYICHVPLVHKYLPQVKYGGKCKQQRGSCRCRRTLRGWWIISSIAGRVVE